MAQKITDIGNVRELNEDSVDIDITPKYSFYIVCDGIGGHNAGEVASSETVRIIKEYIREYYRKSIAPQILESAVVEANSRIYEMGSQDESKSGMGTTVTCALKTGDDVFIAHVGDSSAFLIKKEEAHKLTKDHSMVQELVDSGSITEEEMRNHPNRNIITRSIGTMEEVKVDIINVRMEEGDHIILCTDGLSDYISKEEMLLAYNCSESDESFLKHMVDIAKKRGGRDNISLVIFGGEDQ